MLRRTDLASAFSPRKNLRRLFFRKVGAGPDHLAPLDGLRALALTWVILIHVGWYAWFSLPLSSYAGLLHAWWMQPIWRGDFSVDVFFVMSAFLIGGIITDEHARMGRVNVVVFYARRFLRLWPTLLVAVVFEATFMRESADYVHVIWPNIFYVNNLLPILTVRMGWTWSLAIEEQFYLTVPWFLRAMRAIERRWQGSRLQHVDPVLVAIACVMVVMCSIVAGIVVHHDLHPSSTEIAVDRAFPLWARDYDILYSKPWMRTGPLLAGIACSRLYRRRGFMEWLGRTGWRGSLGLVVAFAIGIASMQWPLFEGAPRAIEVLYVATYRTVFGIVVGYGMLLMLTPHPTGARIGRALGHPVFYPIANLAYCAYLVNPMVAYRTHQWLGPSLEDSSPIAAFLTWMPLDLMGTFAGALILSVLVERPFMELRRVLAPEPRKLADAVPAPA